MDSNFAALQQLHGNLRVAIYCRLSKDDNLDGESASIHNQRDMLEAWCQEHGFTVAGVYADDGYSGLYMDRPDFQRMLADCKQGKIDIVVTKDMSRLTRNSTHSGQLRDEFFPKHHIRYIGVTDGVDTGKDDDLIAFRSVFNEIYSKDIAWHHGMYCRRRWSASVPTPRSPRKNTCPCAISCFAVRPEPARPREPRQLPQACTCPM